MSTKALRKAVKIAGSQSELARRMGVDQRYVWNWLTRGLPVERVLAVESAVDGQVTRHELRPDIYPE